MLKLTSPPLPASLTVAVGTATDDYSKQYSEQHSSVALMIDALPPNVFRVIF